MLTCSSNSRFTSGGAAETVWAIASNSVAVRFSRLSAITATASLMASGVEASARTDTASIGVSGATCTGGSTGRLNGTVVVVVAGGVVATGRITGPSAGLVAGLAVLVDEEGAVGTVLGGLELAVEVVPTDDSVDTRVVVDSGDVVDDNVDDVSSGRVDSGGAVVVVSGMDVVELVVDDGCELLVGGNEVTDTVEGGTVLVVVSGIVVVVVGHSSTILVVVVSGKDVVFSCTVVVDTAVVSTTVVVVVVVVVLVVVVTLVDVVGTIPTAFPPKSYWTPCHHAFGLPQQTPARRRYQPGCKSI